MNILEQLKLIDTTPVEFSGKEFFTDERLSKQFYAKIISQYDFYIFIREDLYANILKIKFEDLSRKTIKFVTFSFSKEENNQYLSFCLENDCFIFSIDDLNHLNDFLLILAKQKVHFISSNMSDYEKIQAIISQMNEENFFNSNKKRIIDTTNLFFPNELEINAINEETNHLMSKIGINLLKFPVFRLTKEAISTFSIRKFYFRTSFFENPIFFEYKLKSNNELQEFKNNDFISLRKIANNIELVLYKETNQLFVQKYFKFPFFEDFKEEMYRQINKMNRFVKCFGYIKRENNVVESLIIEFMSGKTVQEKIEGMKKEEDDDDFIKKYKISFQLIEELKMLHSKNIIHRDLKPDNLFINHDSLVFIGDFDSSRFVSSENYLYSSDIGSITYSSPELINSEPYSKSTDIYSYGLLLYFIFTGKEPYQSMTYQKIIDLKNDKKFSHFEEEIPDESIQRIYSKCQKFKPEERPNEDEIIKDFINISIERCMKYKPKFLFYLIEQQKVTFEEIISLYKRRGIDVPNVCQLLYHIMTPLFCDHEITEKQFNPIMKFLANLANKNQTDAQLILGKMYINGGFVSNDLNNIFKYMKFSENNEISYDHDIFKKVTYGSKFISQNPEKGFHYVTLAADGNNQYAQFYLGSNYFKSYYLQPNVNKAIHYLTLSADQNNINAIFYLALIYLSSDKVPRDINKGIHYLTIATSQRNPLLDHFVNLFNYQGEDYMNNNESFSSKKYYNLGLYHYEEGDIMKAIQFLTLSSNQNNADAQNILGLIYLFDQHIPHDINRAIYYFTLSANQNNSNSQFYLGYLYFDDKFIPKDINKSLYYLFQSANQNNFKACFLLGLIYSSDQYFMKDNSKAIFYFTLAANQNEPNSQYRLALFYLEGIHVKQDVKKAIRYFTLSANQKNEQSCLALGTIYLENTFVFQDINKSIYYLTIAADNYNVDSQYILGDIYYSGFLIRRDINKAIHYWKEASSLGDSKSKNNLGLIYKNGFGVKKNIYNTIECLNEAIKKTKDNYSIYNLARIFYFGIDVKRNIQESIVLLNQIDDEGFIPSQLLSFLINSKENNSSNSISVAYNDFPVIVLSGKDSPSEKILYDFLNKYDLFHSFVENPIHNFFKNLLSAFNHESFKERKKKDNRKDINEFFYQGFYS